MVFGGWEFSNAIKIAKLQMGKIQCPICRLFNQFSIECWIINLNFYRRTGTHCSCCHGDGDGGDEGKIVPWVNTMPQGRQDKGQCQPVLWGSVITHTEDMRGIEHIQKSVCQM